MKTWVNASIEELNINETAFGLDNPDTPDSEKTQITIDGVVGWKQEYGENKNS